MLLLRCCYDPTTKMKIRLRLVYTNGDVAATLLRPRRWSYAFVALLYHFEIKYEVQLIHVQVNVKDRLTVLQLAIMLDNEVQARGRRRTKRSCVRP